MASSLSLQLPEPKNRYEVLDDVGGSKKERVVSTSQQLVVSKENNGNKDALTLRRDNDGSVSFDAIAKRGRGKNEQVYSRFTDLIEKRVSENDLARPSDDQVAETAAKTAEALLGIMSKQDRGARPNKRGKDQNANASGNSTFIKYKPRAGAFGYNPATKERVIRMVEAQVDPMEPPKFRLRKVPRGQGSPPVPVMHSPKRKATAEEQESWEIPPCISNWKNKQGFTIALDKRLAAEGRGSGINEVTINSKFATLSEALYVAERKARKEVELRAQMRRNVALQNKTDREEELREMAARARRAKTEHMDRYDDSGGGGGGGGGDGSGFDELDDDDLAAGLLGTKERKETDSSDDELEDAFRPNDNETEEEREARRQRNQLREERRMQRERDFRREAKGHGMRSKTTRDHDRDVSERVALGMPVGKANRKTQYDTRLFNQSEGLSSGFRAEDADNAFTTELFPRRHQKIYTGRNSESAKYGTAEEHLKNIVESDRFKPSKDFAGVDRSAPREKRNGPVQFERRHDVVDHDEEEEEDVDESDPFGLDQFLSETKESMKKPLDHIGKRGGLTAAAGGGGFTAMNRDPHAFPQRDRVEFVAAEEGKKNDNVTKKEERGLRRMSSRDDTREERHSREERNERRRRSRSRDERYGRRRRRSRSGERYGRRRSRSRERYGRRRRRSRSRERYERRRRSRSRSRDRRRRY